MDGDQMSIKGIFSQEANAECDKIVRSKANILDINASNVRKSENEAIHHRRLHIAADFAIHGVRPGGAEDFRAFPDKIHFFDRRSQ